MSHRRKDGSFINYVYSRPIKRDDYINEKALIKLNKM